MLTNIPTLDITKEEVRLLDNTHSDFSSYGKTDVKCPRCGGYVLLKEFGTSYMLLVANMIV